MSTSTWVVVWDDPANECVNCASFFEIEDEAFALNQAKQGRLYELTERELVQDLTDPRCKFTYHNLRCLAERDHQNLGDARAWHVTTSMGTGWPAFIVWDQARPDRPATVIQPVVASIEAALAAKARREDPF